MKTTNPSVTSKPGAIQGTKSFLNFSRAIRPALGAVSWTLLLLAVVMSGYFIGWVVIALIWLRSSPAGEVIPIVLATIAFSCLLAWLVARYFTSARKIALLLLAALALILIAGVVWTQAYPDQALFWARQLAWSESSVRDYERFPERAIGNSAPAFHFEQDLSPELFQTIEYSSNGERRQMDFEDFLQSTQTTSFIVIKEDAILYEGYFNGYSRESIVTSFSVAKSLISALIGIAIDEGYIGSVDDRMIAYIPELKGKGLDEVTIRDLLLMSAGIRYVTDDETSSLAQITQFTDDGLTYAYPNLRSLALHVKSDGNAPGTTFNYNNYHPILLGMILERTIGRPVAEYLQEKIWKPLGMEYPASWSLDSSKSGFELMQSGINARAIDFAKFGRLFLDKGNWNGHQIVSEQWVTESTEPDPYDQRTWQSDEDWKEANGYYKYLWWGKFRSDGNYDYMAQGHLGQRIYVSPQERVVIVRFGMDDGGVDSWAEVLQDVAVKAREAGRQAGEPAGGQLSSDDFPAWSWRSSTPEEQGVDSAKLAELLIAIRQRRTDIHSLMIVRNGAVILDAYFYPYDGSIYHDLASVTKSVMTTLIGIAADQGKLDLDQPILSFFPGRAVANRDERKERITIRHLAGMAAGLACDPMDDETDMQAMRASEDWVQYTLDRKVVREPGTSFTYCGLQMHLLSAILQEATGMTALEFARLNLFEPLGIREVYWPSDPQGYTHGWGDIALLPTDMAKLGLLFLNQGKWDGKRIVSREWVTEATRQQIGTPSYRNDDYGYGWWVSRPAGEFTFYSADGRGGQYIRVIPSLNLILVTTGGGFSITEIDPYLIAALGYPSNPLPPNTEGQKQLDAMLIELAEPPTAEPVATLPEISQVVSSRTYEFEPNTAGARSLLLDFNEPDEALLQLTLDNEPSPRVMAIGLDGIYRASQDGRPVYSRGSWIDASTFAVECDEGPGLAKYTIKLHFDGERLNFEVPGMMSLDASVDQQ